MDAPETESNQSTRMAAMVEVHYDHVWRLLRRLGLREPEDAAQQVFIVAGRKLSHIESGKEKAFLSAVAVRVAADCRRSVRRRKESGEEPLDVASPGLSQEELLDHRRAREALDRILDGLADDLRETFVLYEIEELTSPQIAETLGIPLGTVASRLRRARDAFKDAVDQLRASLDQERKP